MNACMKIVSFANVAFCLRNPSKKLKLKTTGKANKETFHLPVPTRTSRVGAGLGIAVFRFFVTPMDPRRVRLGLDSNNYRYLAPKPQQGGRFGIENTNTSKVRYFKFDKKVVVDVNYFQGLASGPWSVSSWLGGSKNAEEQLAKASLLLEKIYACDKEVASLKAADTREKVELERPVVGKLDHMFGTLDNCNIALYSLRKQYSVYRGKLTQALDAEVEPEASSMWANFPKAPTFGSADNGAKTLTTAEVKNWILSLKSISFASHVSLRPMAVLYEKYFAKFNLTTRENVREFISYLLKNSGESNFISEDLSLADVYKDNFCQVCSNYHKKEIVHRSWENEFVKPSLESFDKTF